MTVAVTVCRCSCVYLRPRFDCQAKICQFRSRTLAAHSLSDIVLAYECSMQHAACSMPHGAGSRRSIDAIAAWSSSESSESVNIIGQIDVACSRVQIRQQPRVARTQQGTFKCTSRVVTLREDGGFPGGWWSRRGGGDTFQSDFICLRKSDK